jgi:arylsulfatase A-like enzyme
MKLRGRTYAILGILAVVLIGGWVLFQNYWYYIPGYISDFKDPIAANHPVTWGAGPETASVPVSERPPNIVVILADDLGFNDITANGGGVAGGLVPTPNIDSIAKSGVRFVNGYAGNATCAPSRAAIMTGRYATRFGFEFTPTPKGFMKLVSTFDTGLHKSIYRADLEDEVPPVAVQAVPRSEIMMPEALKKQGYRTLFLGKWHLGEAEQFRMESRGFDDALGFSRGASLYLPKGDPRGVESRQNFDPIDRFLWANLRFAVTFNNSQRFQPPEYMTDYLGKEAVKAIHANRNRPFFMYFAPNAPHTPLQATKADYDALPQIKNHTLRVYGAMIRALDRNVGRVLQALKDEGLDQNTLVIFTSDNGGANYIGLPDINKPYRGWKLTFFEGGIHVPFFMKWPGKIPAGEIYPNAVAHVDIFATALAAAGAQMPTDRVMDGVNLLPYVEPAAEGAAPEGTPHKTLFWRSRTYRAMIEGDWKIQSAEIPKKTWLYDLKTDPTEQHNLADSDPGKVKELLATMMQIDRRQAKPLWPSLGDGPVEIDHPLSYPEKPGDEYIYWSN